MPAYGDTPEYLLLARTLRVDQVRTIFYPLVLRGVSDAAGWLHVPFIPALYLLQTGIAAACIAYLVSTVFAATLPPTHRIGSVTRRLVVGAITVVLLTMPLVNHFDTTVLTDSLAASFFVLALAGMIRIAVLGDLRGRTVAVALLGLAVAELIRPERVVIVECVLVLMTFGVARGAVRRRGARLEKGRPHPPGNPHHGRRLAVLAALVFVPCGAVVAINRATQTADYGRLPESPITSAFSRAVWPRLELIRPRLPAEVQRVIPVEVARRFDGSSADVAPVIERLRAAAGGSDRLVRETTFVALSCCWPAIVGESGFDLAKYAVPPVAYAAEDLAGTRTPTAWTDSRMAMAHPTLTRAYVVWSFVVLGLVQIPLLLVAATRRRERRGSAIAPGALAALLGSVAVSAALYALITGFNMNVRYALPAYLIEYTLLVVANARVVLELAEPDDTISTSQALGGGDVPLRTRRISGDDPVRSATAPSEEAPSDASSSR